MSSNIRIIRSGDYIGDVNHHFKVTAGPGAGKTYWLVNHIKNTIRRSNKLTLASKIACITYTSIASEQIKMKLNESNDKVDVSTIHSFLYKNIIKPYVYLLRDRDGEYIVNFKEMDSHEENLPSGKFYQWVNNNPRKLFYLYSNENVAKKCLSNLSWKLNNDKCILVHRNPYEGLNKFSAKGNKYSFPNKESLLLEYKKLFWQQGRIHHEDVLYFSYRILKEYPEIKQFLSLKYPYIFIDEFQDTNPIQTIIMKWLAEAGSIIGVIGDPAQSIYAFQDAKCDDFKKFQLPGQIDYEIKDNRRSTKKIVSLLNYVRKDDTMKQESLKDEGNDVCVIITDNVNKLSLYFINELKKLQEDTSFCILSWRRDEVSMLKCQSKIDSDSILANLVALHRESFLRRLLSSFEYINQGRIEIAIKELSRLFKPDSEGKLNRDPIKGIIKSNLEARGIAVVILNHLYSHKDEIMKYDIYQFYNEIGAVLSKIGSCSIKLTAIKGRKTVEIAKQLKVSDVINSLKLFEDKSNIRTIHGAKGAEYGGVLLFLREGEIDYILEPKINAEEDNYRIFYVALSRAKDLLFISSPSMSQEKRSQLAKLGLGIKIIDV